MMSKRAFLFAIISTVSFAVSAAHPWSLQTTPDYQYDATYLTFSGIQEQYFRALEQANNRMVVAGSHGTLAFSDDGGSSWSPATVNVSLRNAVVFDVVYSNGTWVAVTGPTGRAIVGPQPVRSVLSLRSVDGAVWQVNTSVLQGSQIALRNLAADGVGGWIAAASAPRVAVSTDDGVTWTTVNAAPVGTVMTGVAFFSGAWFVSGHSVDNPGTATLFRSNDRGVTWAVDRQFTHTIDALAVANGRLFAVGEDRAISSTANGSSWTQHSHVPGTGLSLRDVAWTPSSGYVVGGEAGVFMYSKTLTSWQFSQLPDAQFIFDVLRHTNGNDFVVSTSALGIYRGRP